MNFELKREHIESIQKDLSSVCFSKCFSPELPGVSKPCLDNCYKGYIAALNFTSKRLISHALDSSSLYGYKLYNDVKPYYTKYYTGEDFMYIWDERFGSIRNVFDFNRGVSN